MLDKIKLSLSAVLLVGGIVASYMMADLPAVVRFLIALIGLVLSGVVMSFSPQGKELIQFAKDAIVETKKVVWPNKKETVQTTGVVVAFVFVMALVLWGIDGTLSIAINLLLGLEG
ncbi:MAG: preprotein translocase subunit SecE [Burkholderiales bacterium]|jgi:preprotein translocase subunit SecE